MWIRRVLVLGCACSRMLEIGVHKMKYLALDLRYYFSPKFYYFGWVKNFYNVIEVIRFFFYLFCTTFVAITFSPSKEYVVLIKGIYGTNLKFFQKISAFNFEYRIAVVVLLSE
jgi:hypothetical protein